MTKSSQNHWTGRQSKLGESRQNSETNPDKMENVNVMEIVLFEIDIIAKEQSMIDKYNNELEDRRLRLMEFVQNSGRLQISTEARDSLLQNVSTMELKVTKSSNLKGKNVTLKKKCRHNNFGYCKMKSECIYYHSDQICDKFLANGKCTEARLCLDRHPKECKFWLEDPQGCLRGQTCK